MEQEKSVPVESTWTSSSFVSVAGRNRFSVELRPGETTIVSWKKLVKDMSKVDRRSSVSEVPSNAHPALDSHLAIGKIEAQPLETGAEDPPPANRFSAVIEKIERLYMGKDSSDDEDLNDVVDDDQYDTEDSFIDDAELDEYFQVDNSAIKHDGFFVNRGILERIEAPLSPPKQPKKRRRKDLANDIDAPTKHVKLGKKASRKLDPMVERNFATAPVVALPSVHYEDMKSQNQMNASITIRDKKKSSDARIVSDSSLPPRSINDNASLSVPEEKDINKQKVVTQSLKHQKSFDKVSNVQLNFQSGRSVSASDELDQSIHRRVNGVIHERVVVNSSPGKSPLPTMNDQVIQRREGSSLRPKSTVLEKAIRELEKMVAESARPSGVEVQDADTSPAVKRRLPREVKLKLAKVARLAQASHGKISKELINRLMSIVGHLVQLRTLKRNLNIMVNMGLSAKKEKDDRFQQMKKEFREMVDSRVPHMKSKVVIEQQTGSSHDFRAIENEEKVKVNYNMDDILEDKMCDLYDLYVEGLDEDAGPLVRKLYAELARLWPDGLMDNRGIKHAIFRAKDRRKILYKRHKDHEEKIRRKKVLTPKTEGNVQWTGGGGGSSMAQTQHKRQDHGMTSVGRPLTDSTTDMTVRMTTSISGGGGLDHHWPSKDKVKGTNNPNETTTRVIEGVAMKKVKKRKPGLPFGGINDQSCSNVDRSKSHSQQQQQQLVTPALHKPSINTTSSAPLTNLE